ncbi:MAG: hypothetical protein IKB56_07895 [Clostridia bacterium]|nr:hypothetical protein [Clostridia bacterium]
MKIRILTLIVALCLLISLSACSSNENKIFINGDIEETIEANTTFVDKGVSFPKDLTLITDGSVDTSKLGRQTIRYRVFSPDGELVKEMYRFVNVVDSTAPTYSTISGKIYYVGFNYALSDFIYDYGDNYCEKSEILISNNNFVFSSPGQHNISITFIDSSNNSASYATDINVVLDIEKLIYEIYKNQTYKISSGDTGIGSHYTRVNISSGKSFSYYDSGSLHYIETVTTQLGKRASIQISAHYGDFDNADISFHISGVDDEYSVGFATVDATQQSVSVNSFYSTINNLNLDTNKMIGELNLNLNTVINNFQAYMNSTLHLELK